MILEIQRSRLLEYEFHERMIEDSLLNCKEHNDSRVLHLQRTILSHTTFAETIPN